MDIISVQIFGLIIGEPTTTITDIILSAISFALMARVRDNMNESFFYNYWKMFFLFMGISTGFGTVAHALNGSQATELYDVFWKSMVVASGISVYYAVQATLQFMNAADNLTIWMKRINLFALVAFSSYTLILNDFEVFKVHAGIGLFIIFMTHLVAWNKKHWGSGWIVSGMLLSFLTVLIHTTELSFSAWFNYKDISHVIMMLSLVFIYKGIRDMRDMHTLSVFRAYQNRLVPAEE